MSTNLFSVLCSLRLIIVLKAGSFIRAFKGAFLAVRQFATIVYDKFKFHNDLVKKKAACHNPQNNQVILIGSASLSMKGLISWEQLFL